MVQSTKRSELWPPCFVPPPSPLPHNNLASDPLSTYDLILQCINKQKDNANGKHDERCGFISSSSDNTNNVEDLQHPLKKRAKVNHVWRSKSGSFNNIGILRNNNLRRQTNNDAPVFVPHDPSDDAWYNVTIQNNNMNYHAQERWRGSLAFPVDLSRENRSDYCFMINENWASRYAQTLQPSLYYAEKATTARRVRISMFQTQPIFDMDSTVTHCMLQSFKNNDKENRTSQHKKRPKASPAINKSKEQSSLGLLNDIKANLHSRAERKITRIATWNINNGFDHLAIASIMAKKDIDILALQEPRISYSTKDDVWISTMRKELRKCKYEIISSQFSYIIFDEQTSGAALASIIRQLSKVQGRLLSVTFKSNDQWEVHTVISIYAVTNAKSGKKYAHSHNSRKDVNIKLTKALNDEITYLQETFGDAPITIVGDYQDTIHVDSRDNIGIVGKKMHPNGPLQMLLNLDFQSAFHMTYPDQQQVTRWNGSKTAGRHIDLQMLNDSAASLLNHIIVDDLDARNHITSDHLIVIADYKIEKMEQDIIESYRTKINFRKIAGIKLKLEKKISKCRQTSSDTTYYSVAYDHNQFMSLMVQDQLKLLERWQNAATSNDTNDILTALENSMQALEHSTLSEDTIINAIYDIDTSTVQRKLVERNLERRSHIDSIYNSFQKALYQIAISLKIVSTENKQVDALCTRQMIKTKKTKRYGENIINLTAPTSKIRTALGDLKNAEATLRNLQHHIADSEKNPIDKNVNSQKCFYSLSKNATSLKYFREASSQLLTCHDENIENETAVSNHRKLDAFSGRWHECKFSLDICKNLIHQTNDILKRNNVKQRVGIRQLDTSSNDDDHWTDLESWWNGPDLATLANSPNIDISDPAISEAIRNALVKTRKFKKKAMATLIYNKEKMLTHDARMNHTRNISRRLNPKIMDEPEAHHVILNPDNIHANSNARCNNFQQCLDSTLLYHQNWMDRSGSVWEHHWFKTSSKFGHIDGIKFNFTGKPTDADFQRLVLQHQDCSEAIQKAFQNAHSEEIASIMQPPPLPHRAFDWKWHPNSTDTDWNLFVDNYWKAISSIPGKARFNGYTMAIIGRLPRRWIDLHLRMMKMMMILRILPEKTKIQARVPIPKSKPGETRPLSLINDDMCFILGFLTKHFTLKCEEINLFPPSLRAYRQGMGTSFITLVDLAMREDALSFGRYMALTAEDEEKFFDRVSLEVQLAVLFILGFPMEGLLEMKAEEMDNITVEIHTRHGQVIGKFLHGLKQGSPFSVLMSNLTIIFKHRVWGLRDPLATAEDPNGYSMSTWNKSIDGNAPPLVSMEGFCDDNSKWNMGNGWDFKSLVRAIQWNLKLAGDLSMVFKIGRRGDKTIIEIFNVNLEDIYSLPERGFTSIAWDFKANRPTEDEVDCRVYLKSGQILPTDKPTSLSKPVWNMLLKGTSLKSERSLGIWRNKLGDTSESADKRAFLFGVKIDRLNLSSLKNDKTIKIAINSLAVPVFQFGILENKCCPEVYDKMDIVLINKVRKALGFAWCDAKQLMFVSEENFGMGIRSVSVEMLKSICRELEVQLNDEELIGKILRGRLETFKDASFHHAEKVSLASYNDITKGVRNFIMEAIRHIAQYGLFVRDMTDVKATYQIEAAITLAQHGSFFQTFKHHTLGMHDFMGTGSRSGTTLGHGDTKLLWSIIYGRCHTLLNGRAIQSNVKLNFSSEQLQTIKEKALELLQDDLQALYTVFEWSNSCLGPSHPELASNLAYLDYYEQSLNNTKNWRRISALSCLKSSSTEDIISEIDNFCFLNGLLSYARSELLKRIDSQYISPNRLTLSDVEMLLIDGWPLIVATDGGADKVKTNNKRSSDFNASTGVVILHPPDIHFMQYMKASAEEQAHILNQNLLPWRARACSLPTKIGDHITDNAHAECFALILMEEWLPHNIPILLIMDSEAERERYYNLRNTRHSTNRFIIRSLTAGVSKCLGSRLSFAVSKYQDIADNFQLSFASSLVDFCSHAKNWCYNKNGEQSSWKVNQWETGQFRTVWAIRSHQLESNFTISPKNRYKSQLVPNRAFVSANQWADNVCNAIIRLKRNAIINQEPSEIRKWCPPTIKLGLTGPNFIITFNGTCLDRCVSSAVENACNAEFIRRLAQRPTQGLLLRLHNEVYIKPEMIGRQSYHRRVLEGKTKTHTRAMYTDTEYRKAIVYIYAQNENWTSNVKKLQHTVKNATKLYKFLRCPFCITKIAQHDQHIFSTHATENSGLLGNSRHFCYYCLNEQITAVRHQMNQLLEDHLTALFKIASKWGRKGFSSLLDRATSALILLDRSSFHNAHLKNPSYVKQHECFFACFSANDWLSFFESQNTQVESFGKKLFYQWPLVHQFGFIAANSYTLLEMQDGAYSPCDMIALGVIPITLQDIILQFANELGNRHSQEAKTEFKLQWKQVRAVALLRAISIAMVTGAQISEHKSKILNELPSNLPQDASEIIATNDDSKITAASTSTKRKLQKIPDDNIIDRFPCKGITCSSLFTRNTNLRSSLMRNNGGICRRCLNLNKGITCAEAIESALAENLDSFKSFYNSIFTLDTITFDDIVTAISRIDPLPNVILPSYLKRSTKRNVFPIVTMNTIRFLHGTFRWNMTTNPTSIDIVFNQSPQNIIVSMKNIPCNCHKNQMERVFFAIDFSVSCPFCDGVSKFYSTSTRISLAQAPFVDTSISDNQISMIHNNQGLTKNSVSLIKTISNEANKFVEHTNQRFSKTFAKNYNTKNSQSKEHPQNSLVLRDITNLPHRPPSYLAARPTDTELNGITRVNNMLSNFVVTYFFMLLAHKFPFILYKEFLFDFVKREGSWKQFVLYCRREGTYKRFFEQLLNHNSICIIPICCHAHWTLIIRRFFGNSWKIFFVDSISTGSDQRFAEWKALFQDDAIFHGEWIKVKVFQQSELECGARVCLHGVCFALSKKKCGDIINDLSRFKDLSTRSRLMVSHICKDGFWSYQKWLSRTIGNADMEID